jgi:AcrR family transcriptional regulator
MPTTTSSPRPRLSAAERRDALVAAAVRHFALTGLHGTAVSAITDEVGITQPYAFSLFGTKKGLFLAAVQYGFGRVGQAFRAAAEAASAEERLPAMGAAYDGLLADRDLLLLQHQAYAACGDPEVREVVRAAYRDLYELVRELSGADAERLREFFAKGMLMNVAAAMDWPALLQDESWLEC